MEIKMDPRADYTYGCDGFNNQKITGSVRVPHDHYFLTTEGIVDTNDSGYEENQQDSMVGVFRYPYGKTKAGDKLSEYISKLEEKIIHEKIEDDYEKITYVMNCLNNDFSYDVMATDVETSAEEAFSLGRGVCQDYAHIFITIMRMFGYPARYVVGLMTGEGKSHAWAEVLINKRWTGFDPTNNHVVDENYIKIGDGRDAGDCKINLGIMYGGGSQRQEIEVKVWKE